MKINNQDIEKFKNEVSDIFFDILKENKTDENCLNKISDQERIEILEITSLKTHSTIDSFIRRSKNKMDIKSYEILVFVFDHAFKVNSNLLKFAKTSFLHS